MLNTLASTSSAHIVPKYTSIAVKRYPVRQYVVRRIEHPCLSAPLAQCLARGLSRFFSKGAVFVAAHLVMYAVCTSGMNVVPTLCSTRCQVGWPASTGSAKSLGVFVLFLACGCWAGGGGWHAGCLVLHVGACVLTCYTPSFCGSCALPPSIIDFGSLQQTDRQICQHRA